MRWIPPLLLVAFLNVATIGCRELPIARGPRYTVPGAAMATAMPADIVQAGYRGGTAGTATLAAPANRFPFPIEIADFRPDWERQFRAPAAHPSQHRYAIGFVPLENVSPMDRLTSVVGPVVSPLNPSSVVVDLRSFRVVVNQTEVLRTMHEQGLQPLKDARDAHGFRLGFEVFVASDPSQGYGLRPEPGQAGAPTPFKPVEIVDGKRYLYGPPKRMPNRYEPGVTCEIEATVRVTLADGKDRDFFVTITETTPSATSLDENAVPVTAARGYAAFSRELASHVEAARQGDR